MLTPSNLTHSELEQFKTIVLLLTRGYWVQRTIQANWIVAGWNHWSQNKYVHPTLNNQKVLTLFTSHQVGHSDMHEPKEVEALKLNHLDKSPKSPHIKKEQKLIVQFFVQMLHWFQLSITTKESSKVTFPKSLCFDYFCFVSAKSTNKPVSLQESPWILATGGPERNTSVKDALTSKHLYETTSLHMRPAWDE